MEELEPREPEDLAADISTNGKQGPSRDKLQARVASLESYIRVQMPKCRAVKGLYQKTLEKLKISERLNQIHPDTGLPIYRYLLRDLEILLAHLPGSLQALGPDHAPQGEEGEPWWSHLSKLGGCAEVFANFDMAQGFTVLLIRLDEAYSKIRNSRDRQKALLFKSAYRIKAEVSEACMYQSDRLEEFYLVLPGVAKHRALRDLMTAVSRAVSKPHDPPAEDIRFGAAVAATTVPAQARGLEEILTNLEIAMEGAELASTRISIYRDEMGRRFRHRSLLEIELQRAIQRGFEDFRLVLQPFCGIDGSIHGAEVLIRWQHPGLGQIAPSQFIPIAEANGSIRLLGRWILFQSCRMLARWQKEGIRDMQIAVNLSPLQFLQDDLVETILNVLKVNQLPAGSLKLEITEGAIMEDPEDSIEKMKALREAGIRLCIDDFGTGYSSLAYLKRLPVDVLKIDKSFVDDISTNQNNQQIVRAIINLAKNLQMETLAEGVEYREQLEFLNEEGADFIQGYYFSPPVDEAAFRAFLDTGGRLPLS